MIGSSFILSGDAGSDELILRQFIFKAAEMNNYNNEDNGAVIEAANYLEKYD